MSDGTGAGTLLVKDIKPGPASSSPDELTNVSGTLFFAADDGIDGIEIWRTDSGTLVITGGSGGCFISALGSSGASSMSPLLVLLLLAAAGVGCAIRRVC